MKRAFSLIELMVASAVLLVVVLAVFTLDKSGRDFYRSAERKALISAEVGFAIDHMQKYLSQVSGMAAQDTTGMDINKVSINGAVPNSIAFYIDLNDPQEPKNLARHTLMYYQEDSASNSIYFCDNWDGDCDNGKVEYLAEGYILSADFSEMTNSVIGNDPVVATGLNLHIRSRFDPDPDPSPDPNVDWAHVDVYNNPKYELKTSIFFGEYSLS